MLRRRKVRKVQLINAPIDGNSSSSGNVGCYPHLGLLSIGTHLLHTCHSIELEILDGTIVSLPEILDRIDADLVGISVLTSSYESGLSIAEAAKNRDAFVVLGNDHASSFVDSILQRRAYVDAIVYGDFAEIPFAHLVQYLNGELASADSIRSLAYRDGHDRVKINPYSVYPLQTVPIPDRSLVAQPDVYNNNYHLLYGKWHKSPVRTTNTAIARGCGWGQKDSRRCTYCSIPDLQLRHVPVERVWREARILQEAGINFLYEVCDSFTSLAVGTRHDSKSFVEQLIEGKPTDINVEWFVYSRAQDINERTVALLKQLNVARVNIGMDSGDDLMLRTLSKGNSKGPGTNVRAVELLIRAQIQLYMSIVLASFGETVESLQRTLNHVEELLQFGNIVALTSSPLLPLPGSKAWRMMMDPQFAMRQTRIAKLQSRFDTDFRVKYQRQDVLDTASLAKDWIRGFCEADYETILHYDQLIKQVAAKQGAFVGGFGIRTA